MSRSSLWYINDDYQGDENNEYSNSWLFSPIIWDILLDKYMGEEIRENKWRKNMILNGREIAPKLNKLINNSDIIQDRILWEISNQQIFFVEDKKLISQCIREFIEINKGFTHDNDYKECILKEEHIIKRFLEIANDIDSIPDNIKCFVFKNTSCDDNVEYWFYDEKSLKDFDNYVSEFVIIDDNKIKFMSNLDYFKEVKNE